MMDNNNKKDFSNFLNDLTNKIEESNDDISCKSKGFNISEDDYSEMVKRCTQKSEERNNQMKEKLGFIQLNFEKIIDENLRLRLNLKKKQSQIQRLEIEKEILSQNYKQSNQENPDLINLIDLSKDEKEKEDIDAAQIISLENKVKDLTEKIENNSKYEGFDMAIDLLKQFDLLQTNFIKLEKDEAINSNYLTGFKIIFKEIIQTFEKYGINQIQVNVGDEFDFNLHESQGFLENSYIEPGKIASIIRNGYTFKDKVLLHTLVKIAKEIN